MAIFWWNARIHTSSARSSLICRESLIWRRSWGDLGRRSGRAPRELEAFWKTVKMRQLCFLHWTEEPKTQKRQRTRIGLNISGSLPSSPSESLSSSSSEIIPGRTWEEDAINSCFSVVFLRFPPVLQQKLSNLWEEKASAPFSENKTKHVLFFVKERNFKLDENDTESVLGASTTIMFNPVDPSGKIEY